MLYIGEGKTRLTSPTKEGQSYVIVMNVYYSLLKKVVVKVLKDFRESLSLTNFELTKNNVLTLLQLFFISFELVRENA